MTPPDTIRLVGATGPPPDVGRTVRLKQKVPVYILYLTAYVRDGVLNFRGDPYGKDAEASARLAPPRPRDRRLCEEIARALPR